MKDYKRLADTMYKRKSVRVYSREKSDILENDGDLIKALEIQPLAADIKVIAKILRKDQINNDRSDYCVAFYSEKKAHYLENIGFIGQQIDLELQSSGLGTCWWGMKKPNKNFSRIDGLDCVVTMSAGLPQTAETRNYPEGFKRKTVNEITLSGTDKLIEAARIAPSAVNLQPWLIEKIDNKYNFYIRSPKGIIEKMLKDLRRLDIGIAMAHLYVQAKADGQNISFSFEGSDIKRGKYAASAVVI